MTLFSTRQLLVRTIRTFVALALPVLRVSLPAVRAPSDPNGRFPGCVHGIAQRQGLLSAVGNAANQPAIGVRDMAPIATPSERDAAKAMAMTMAVGSNEELQPRIPGS